MNIPGDGIEGLRMMAEASGPYRGEVKEPVTLLDAMVRDVIDTFGNDNLPAIDLYTPAGQQRQLEPAAELIAGHGERLRFGEDYLTHVFDAPGQKLTYVYNKKFAQGRIVVDGFAEGGGLAYRTTFDATETDPAKIYKARQSDFKGRSIAGLPFQDFHRQLSPDETNCLSTILVNPMAASTSGLQELAGEDSHEARMTTRNRAEYDKELKEHHEYVEAITRARRAGERLLGQSAALY